MVNIGSKAGAGVANGWTLPSFFVAMVKKGLFTSKYWGIMGQKEPAI